MWIASLTLLVYQYESQSIYFTSLQSGWWPVLLACSERAEVLGKLDSIEASSSLPITFHYAENKAYFCQNSFHNCLELGTVRLNLSIQTKVSLFEFEVIKGHISCVYILNTN